MLNAGPIATKDAAVLFQLARRTRSVEPYSGVDAAVNLAKAGKQATVLASTATWNVQTVDPSSELAQCTTGRLREV